VTQAQGEGDSGVPPSELELKDVRPPFLFGHKMRVRSLQNHSDVERKTIPTSSRGSCSQMTGSHICTFKKTVKRERWSGQILVRVPPGLGEGFQRTDRFATGRMSTRCFTIS
jgi:hypothetical protein